MRCFPSILNGSEAYFAFVIYKEQQRKSSPDWTVLAKGSSTEFYGSRRRRKRLVEHSEDLINLSNRELSAVETASRFQPCPDLVGVSRALPSWFLLVALSLCQAVSGAIDCSETGRHSRIFITARREE